MQQPMTTEDEALDWVVRIADPTFDGWEQFEAWLSAAPANAAAYHAVALDDIDMAEILAAAPPASPPAASPRHANRRNWIGGALAASLVAAIGAGYLGTRPARYVIETAPGARRVVALADGSRITLNGATRLLLDRHDARTATLERGEAMFAVIHDEARPFRVSVGDATLVDVGTAFDVVRAGTATRVAVSEGAVVYNPAGEAIRLDAGRSLRTTDGGNQIVLNDVTPDAVAAWRSGRLVYDGQPLSEVAADLARYYGRPVSVAPAIAGRSFRGVLSLDVDGDIGRLAPLLETQVTREGAGWRLSAP